MAIHFKCSNPDCQKPMRAPDGTEGKKASCPFCNTVQVIPSAIPETPADDTFGPIDFSDDSFANKTAAGEQKICDECHSPMPSDANVCPGCGHIAGAEEGLEAMADAGQPIDQGEPSTQTKSNNMLFLALAGVGAIAAIIAIAFILMGNGDEKKSAGKRTKKPRFDRKARTEEVVQEDRQDEDIEPDEEEQDEAALKVKPADERPQRVPTPVLDARTKSKRDRSVTQMQRLAAKLLEAAQYNEGKFPETPQEMRTSASMLRSPGNSRQNYQYVPGQSLDNPENIVMYDPFGYQGTFVALQAGGAVEIFNSQELLQKKLQEQNN